VVTTAYLMQSPNKEVAILCFRGTEPTNIVNWLTDLSVSTDRFLEGDVHGGILRNFRAIWPLVSMGLYMVDIGEDIGMISAPVPENTPPLSKRAIERTEAEQKLSPLKALYIAGHSLGGAMAALASAYIWKNPAFSGVRDNLLGCYTYGAPMVAAPHLADALDSEIKHRVYRHVYASDVVPQLPPRTTGEFKHFGQEYNSSNSNEGWKISPTSVKQTPYASFLPFSTLGLVSEQFPVLRGLFKNLPISIDHHSPCYYMRISELSRGPLT
jgi:hypothetical protein